jgi:hypothetical protein
MIISKETRALWGKLLDLLAQDMQRSESGSRASEEIETAILHRVKCATDEGFKLSLRRQAKYYLGNFAIKSPGGQFYREQDIVSAAKKLVDEGKLVEVKNQHTGNGLSLPGYLE